MYPQGIGNVSEIGRDRDLHATARQSEADRIHGIMRNCEASDVKIADSEPAARLKDFAGRRRFAPIDKLAGAAREIHRQRSFGAFYQSNQAACVVAMFMRDQNCVEICDIFADRGQPLADFTAAESGVNQNPGTIRRNEGRITRTAGRENANLNDFLLLAFFLLMPTRLFLSNITELSPPAEHFHKEMFSTSLPHGNLARTLEWRSET